MPAKKQGKYQFSDFEIDLAARTLVRLGHPILASPVAISPRAFHLLVILVLNAQRVVSKEELMRVISPDADTAESSLGQHIFLLQKALTASEPGEKLILRIPGLGYKLTAQVRELPAAPPAPLPEPAPDPIPEPVRQSIPETISPSMPKSNPEPILEIVPESPPLTQDQGPQIFPRFAGYSGDEPGMNAHHKAAEEVESDAEPRTSLLRSRPFQIAAILLASLLLAGGGWVAERRFLHLNHDLSFHSSIGETSMRLVVASFQNTTGDPAFDPSLKTALILDLQQSPYLSVPPDAIVQQAILGIKNNTFTPRDLCKPLDAQAYLTADVHRLSEKYLVAVRVSSCDAGRNLAKSRGIADTPDGVVSILDKVASDIRKQLGEQKASVAQFSQPLFADRAASLAVLKAYADAAQLQDQGKLDDAIQLFQRAAFLDPKFALAYADLASVYTQQGKTTEANSALTHAWNLKETVDQQHRLILTAAFHGNITGDLQAALANDKQWSSQYPRNPVPLTHQADLEIQLGRPAQALDPAKSALALNPGNPAAYIILARAQMHLGQFEEAEATCQQAIQHQLDGLEIHQFLLQIAYLRLDQPAIDEQMEWAKGKPPESGIAAEMQLQLAQIAFAEGRAKAATAIYQKVADQYRKQNLLDVATAILAQLPRILAELGQADAARVQIAHLPDDENSASVLVALAQLGETLQSESFLKSQLAAQPSATLWQRLYAPQVRAAIAMHQQNPQAAIDALNPAVPPDQAKFDLNSFAIPAMRGRAYLALKQPEKAEAEFHKILDHPGLEPLSYNYVLAQLGLARSLAAQGKPVEATFAYKIVLNIWKDADPDLPRLREAKAEYAKQTGEPQKAASKPAAKPVPKTTPNKPQRK